MGEDELLEGKGNDPIVTFDLRGMGETCIMGSYGAAAGCQFESRAFHRLLLPPTKTCPSVNELSITYFHFLFED